MYLLIKQLVEITLSTQEIHLLVVTVTVTVAPLTHSEPPRNPLGTPLPFQWLRRCVNIRNIHTASREIALGSDSGSGSDYICGPWHSHVLFMPGTQPKHQTD